MYLVSILSFTPYFNLVPNFSISSIWSLSVVIFWMEKFVMSKTDIIERLKTKLKYSVNDRG